MVFMIGNRLVNMDLVRSIHPIQAIPRPQADEKGADHSELQSRTIGISFTFDENHKLEILGPDLFGEVCKRLGATSDLMRIPKPSNRA